jgi:V8-like Glu-specific endopeptidase
MQLHIGNSDYASVPGNSGSPIFNQQRLVVGIHISGVPKMTEFVCLAGVTLVLTQYLVRKVFSFPAIYFLISM